MMLRWITGSPGLACVVVYGVPAEGLIAANVAARLSSAARVGAVPPANSPQRASALDWRGM